MAVFVAVSTFVTLLLAGQSDGLAHVGGRYHLGEWIVRSDFIGIVVPVGAPETVWLETETGNAHAFAGRDETRYVTTENRLRIEVAFYEVRCKVERVIKGPDLAEIKVLTYINRGSSPLPKVLPTQLEAGKSLLVFLTKPDSEGRIDVRQEWQRGPYSRAEIEPSRGPVFVRPGVWGMFNMVDGSFHVLERPATGWPDIGGAPMHNLMECLLASLASAKTTSSAAEILDILVLAAPTYFPRLPVVRSTETLHSLQMEALWPDYNDYCKTRVLPALRTWVDQVRDVNAALRGLAAMLEFDQSERLRNEYFERLLACARTEPSKCYLGGMGILAAFPGHETRLLRLFDAGLEAYALSSLPSYATEQSVPYAKRALQESPRLQEREQRQRYVAAMRILEKVYKDKEHAPPLWDSETEADELWQPGGRLADLLEYWRDKP